MDSFDTYWVLIYANHIIQTYKFEIFLGVTITLTALEILYEILILYSNI